MAAPGDASLTAPKLPLAQGAVIHVAQIWVLTDVPHPETCLSYGFSYGYTEGRVAVEHRDPDLQLSALPVEFLRREALAEEFDAVHLCLGAAPAVISGQLSPECPSEIFAGSHSFVSRDSAHCGWLSGLGIFTRRDNGCDSPSRDHIVTSSMYHRRHQR